MRRRSNQEVLPNMPDDMELEIARRGRQEVRVTAERVAANLKDAGFDVYALSQNAPIVTGVAPRRRSARRALRLHNGPEPRHNNTVRLRLSELGRPRGPDRHHRAALTQRLSPLSTPRGRRIGPSAGRGVDAAVPHRPKRTCPQGDLANRERRAFPQRPQPPIAIFSRIHKRRRGASVEGLDKCREFLKFR